MQTGLSRGQKGICSAIKIPANAFPTNDSYGRGWECKWGFKHIVNTCKKIVIPPNGYLDANSYDWECLRGFRRASNHNDSILKESCVRIEVPENGYLADSTFGSGWKCNRGYRVIGKACVTIKVPKMDILPTQRSKAVGRANAVIEPLEALASQLKCQKRIF